MSRMWMGNTPRIKTGMAGVTSSPRRPRISRFSLGDSSGYVQGSCQCDPSLTGAAWNACVVAQNADTTCYNVGAATSTAVTGTTPAAAATASPVAPGIMASLGSMSPMTLLLIAGAAYLLFKK